MAIVQALLAWLTQSLGRVLNSTFSWATFLLFGKVPQDKQIILSIVSLMSLVWLLVVIGIAFPKFAVFLLTFIPLPAFINDNWIRWIMLGLTLLIPTINGLALSFIHGGNSFSDFDWRKTISTNWKTNVSKGWRLTIALALTLLFMIVIAPFTKLAELIKRWKSEHIPVVIESENYNDVTRQLQLTLGVAGIRTAAKTQNIFMRLPIKLFGMLTGGMLKTVVAENLTKLVFENGELEIRPSDLIVRGEKEIANKVVSLIISNFGFGQAYLTWSKEANSIEDKLRQLWLQLKDKQLPKDGALARSSALLKELQLQNLDKEEWTTLYRLWLKLRLDIWEGVSKIERKAS